MKFHNLDHTMDVASAVTTIGEQSWVTKEQLDLLRIAAWFHDCGYCHAYIGHEDVSIAMATAFLREQNYPESLLQQVSGIINATKMPQKPTNRLDEIICDADLAHLASADYFKYCTRLRKEWELNLSKFYTDREWLKLNIEMFEKHRYFTPYAQHAYDKQKLLNLQQMLAQIA